MMKKMLCFCLIVCSGAAGSALTLSSPGFAQEKLMAVGEDISVTRKEMDILRQRLASFFRTTDAEYCRALLRMKLFAKAAKAKGLDRAPEIRILLEQIVLEQLTDLYIKDLMSSYSLAPEAIESYYLSHLEEFKDTDGRPLPLDETVQDRIREKIMQFKKNDIVNNAFEKLQKEYKVEILDSTCVKKEGVP